MEVVTFLTKIQKSEGNSTTLKNWIQKLEGKPTTLKNGIQKMEGNSTTPKNCVLTIFLHERSTIFFLFFLTNTILNFCQEWFLSTSRSDLKSESSESANFIEKSDLCHFSKHLPMDGIQCKRQLWRSGQWCRLTKCIPIAFQSLSFGVK